MIYDVQTGNTIRRGISYAELVALPIEPDTFVRRGNGNWIHAKDCIELTHVLSQRPNTHSEYQTQVSQTDVDDYSQDEYVEDEIDDCEDEEDKDGGIDDYEEEEDEHIFIPTAEYFKCKQKRKAAIIGVCTLGLAGLSLMGIGNTWRSNIFAGTSFSANAGIGFVLKCLSFFILTALIAIPYFIFSVFALIYYSIRLNSLKR